MVSLFAHHFQEFMDLIANSNAMSTAELSQKKAELKLKHKVIDFPYSFSVFSLIVNFAKMIFSEVIFPSTSRGL